jgi:hypothetical protein
VIREKLGEGSQAAPKLVVVAESAFHITVSGQLLLVDWRKLLPRKVPARTPLGIIAVNPQINNVDSWAVLYQFQREIMDEICCCVRATGYRHTSNVNQSYQIVTAK